MQRVLVTGGAGFIGSNVVNYIADRGEFRAVACDMFGVSDKWRNLSKHLVFEIISPDEVFYWLETNASRLQAVVHLGGVSSTTEKNVDLILQSNFSYTRQLWTWCTQNEKPFIYASSAATYGDGNEGFDDDLSLDYLKKLHPLNAYGWSKQLFDQYVSHTVARGDKTPPQWVGLKFFNVYGPNEYHKESQMSVCAQIVPHAQAGRAKLFKSENPAYADGAQKRDFIYIKDCVRVIDWFLKHPAVSGLFNLGTGEARTFEDLARAAFAALNKEPKISYVEMPEAVRNKYQYFTQANMNRLRQAGYQAPFTSLEDGVRDYVQNYLTKEDPYL